MLLDLKLTLSSSISGWDVANPNWRKAMKNGKERVVRASKKSAAMVTLALWIGGGGTMGLRAQGSMIVVQPERQVTVVQSKCCPFFDFHIDLEGEGKLVCLRLTGEEGIKAFIRAEFKVEK